MVKQMGKNIFTILRTFFLIIKFTLHHFYRHPSDPPLNHHYHLGLDARKPVFRVSDKTRLKPVFIATETS